MREVGISLMVVGLYHIVTYFYKKYKSEEKTLLRGVSRMIQDYEKRINRLEKQLLASDLREEDCFRRLTALEKKLGSP